MTATEKAKLYRLMEIRRRSASDLIRGWIEAEWAAAENAQTLPDLASDKDKDTEAKTGSLMAKVSGEVPRPAVVEGRAGAAPAPAAPPPGPSRAPTSAPLRPASDRGTVSLADGPRPKPSIVDGTDHAKRAPREPSSVR